jgi:hypothetical protein
MVGFVYFLAANLPPIVTESDEEDGEYFVPERGDFEEETERESE